MVNLYHLSPHITIATLDQRVCDTIKDLRIILDIDVVVSEIGRYQVNRGLVNIKSSTSMEQQLLQALGRYMVIGARRLKTKETYSLIFGGNMPEEVILEEIRYRVYKFIYQEPK